jgi:hypothetical protein
MASHLSLNVLLLLLPNELLFNLLDDDVSLCIRLMRGYLFFTMSRPVH